MVAPDGVGHAVGVLVDGPEVLVDGPAVVAVGPDVVVDADRSLEHPAVSATTVTKDVIVRFLMTSACAEAGRANSAPDVTFAPMRLHVGGGI